MRTGAKGAIALLVAFSVIGALGPITWAQLVEEGPKQPGLEAGVAFVGGVPVWNVGIGGWTIEFGRSEVPIDSDTLTVNLYQLGLELRIMEIADIPLGGMSLKPYIAVRSQGDVFLAPALPIPIPNFWGGVTLGADLMMGEDFALSARLRGLLHIWGPFSGFFAGGRLVPAAGVVFFF